MTTKDKDPSTTDKPIEMVTDIETNKPSIAPGTLDVDIEILPEYSDAYLRRLRWKIDLYLLPLMWLCYGTQQADKTSLSVQAVFGIREDTNLVGDQFNWLTTIVYISYMACEFPGNWVMQKLHTGKFLSVVIVLWGVIVLCVAFAKNWAHLMVLRTIQGGLECTISQTFVLMTGAWYTSQEHTLRSLTWGTSNAGMNIITGLGMYGIGLHAERHPGGLAAWKGISFFPGALTITCGVLVWFFLGTPREVRWLSEDEKKAAIARIMGNQTGSDREKRSEFKWEQVWATFRDPQTYFFFFFVTIINALPNGASTTFSKLIWQSFGFSNLETLLKGSTPYYAVSICWCLVVGFVTLRFPNFRFLLMMFSLLPAFSGMLALSLLPTDSMQWTRWGMYIMQVFGTLPGLNIWENKRRAKLVAQMGIDEEESERLGKMNAEADMTDRENVHFWYKY
ncbi:major facilitator superfamily domain-containing protein [Aspergillus undulatus]|uniref:major facilitator superfamily domain-containing protein n=1 Tax=Aspergillus undulatus TaxID=1810928 RepID=UPI003CCDD38F